MSDYSNKVLVKASFLSIETMTALWLCLRDRYRQEREYLFRLRKDGCYTPRFLGQVAEELASCGKEKARVGTYLRIHHPQRWKDMMEEAAVEEMKNHESEVVYADSQVEGAVAGGRVPLRSEAGDPDAPAPGKVPEREGQEVVDVVAHDCCSKVLNEQSVRCGTRNPGSIKTAYDKRESDWQNFLEQM